MTLRLAVLGVGRIGQVHARAIAATEGATLVAAADAVADAAKALASRHGCDVRTVEQIEVAGDVDAVVICTPTDTHADLIERFARAGKAVFCEKPVDLSVARVQACLKVVEATGATLMIGFQRRFDPDFRALKAAIDDGRIGTVEMVTLTSRDPGPPPYDYIERSGGIFRDMAIHDFDVGRWLLGEEVETVQAAASVLVDPEIGRRGDYDSANVILTTASGKQCTITNSRRATYGYDQRIEVLGSGGMLTSGNVRRSTVERHDARAVQSDVLEYFFTERYAEAYRLALDHFADVVTHGEEPFITAEDGRRALILADAARRSARTGQPVAIAY
jgi:myo-inositol 2-dehydrogenase/D-chiro-inositol 1-dehydrogenase